MKIEYDITLDDLLQFGDYWLRTSKTARRYRLFPLLTGAVCIVCLLIGIAALEKSNVILYLALGGIGASAFAWFDYPRRVKRRLAKIYGESENRGALGWHRAELVEAGLTITSEVDALTIGWRGIEDIATTDEHTFVVVGSATAHVIPRRLNSGDYETFVQKLRASWESQLSSASEPVPRP
ncbi:YcxB family protein [bacterium]|nr:YcxB family protein [bacterium]